MTHDFLIKEEPKSKHLEVRRENEKQITSLKTMKVGTFGLTHGHNNSNEIPPYPLLLLLEQYDCFLTDPLEFDKSHFRNIWEALTRDLFKMLQKLLEKFDLLSRYDRLNTDNFVFNTEEIRHLDNNEIEDITKNYATKESREIIEELIDRLNHSQDRIQIHGLEEVFFTPRQLANVVKCLFLKEWVLFDTPKLPFFAIFQRSQNDYVLKVFHKIAAEFVHLNKGELEQKFTRKDWKYKDFSDFCSQYKVDQARQIVSLMLNPQPRILDNSSFEVPPDQNTIDEVTRESLCHIFGYPYKELGQ
jgi:hypothetical protein